MREAGTRAARSGIVRLKSERSSLSREPVYRGGDASIAGSRVAFEWEKEGGAAVGAGLNGGGSAADEDAVAGAAIVSKLRGR